MVNSHVDEFTCCGRSVFEFDVEVALTTTVRELRIARSLDHYFNPLAEKLATEFETVLSRALIQDVDSLIHDRAVNEILCPPRRGGAGARGEAERVRVDESNAVEDIERLRELL